MNPFDQFDEPAASNPFDQFDNGGAAPGIKAKDLAVSLKQGVERLPGMLASLADIPLAAAGLDRPVSRLADLAGEVTGFQPGKWAQEADAQHSPGYHAQQKELGAAWDASGANELSKTLFSPSQWDKLPAQWEQLDGKALAESIAKNPGAVGAMTLESLPSMAAGGAIGKAVKVGAGALGLGALAGDGVGAAAVRAGMGEGAVTAGQVMDQIDKSVDPQTAAAAATGAGVVTGLIGGASGHLATKLGLPDIEMAMAGGGSASPLSLARRVPASMLQEGLLEELPQSMQEQMWQNTAEGKPLGEGVLRQGVEGALAGVATAGAFGALPHRVPAGPPPGPLAQAAMLAPAAQVPPTNAALDTANQGVQAAMDAYQASPELALLQDRGIQMPAPPPDGTLASAAYTAAQTGASQQDPTAQLLRVYPTPEAAQAEIDQRPDAAYLSIIPHPRADTGYAVVRKSPAEVAQLQQVEQDRALGAAATQEAQVRQEQVAQEEEATRQESNIFKSVVDLNRNAAALERTISDSTPPAEARAIRAQAADLRARAEEIHQQAKAERKAAAIKAMTQPPADGAAVAQAQAGDLAQDELAPAPVQPIAAMPATQAAEAQKAQAAQAQVQAANTAGQVRQDQLAQEETPTVDEAASRANTAPTDKQKEAGNYAKGHITVGGLQVAVENPVGSSRSGIEGGKSWTTKMKAHYGYVKRTTGADGDQVDVYVKPGTKTDHAGPVFVVDQYNPNTGAFDEHKVLMGYGSQAEAAKAYDAHFGDKTGPARRGAVTPMSVSAFKQWLKNGDTTAPVSSTKFGDQTASESDAAQEEIRQSGGRLSAKRNETPDQRLARMAAESNARKKERTAAAGLRTKSQHEAAINRTFGIDDAEVVTEMRGANEAAAGEISKQGADFIRQVARLFGKKVVFFKTASNDAADGAIRTDGNTVYLNSTSSVAHLRVLGHELVHTMKVQAPEAFEKMRSALANLLTDEQLAAQHKDYFGTELTDMSALDKVGERTEGATLREFLAEEWMADLSGNRFAEGKFWSDLFSEIEARHGTAAAKGIVARLRMAIGNALNKLLQVIKGGQFSVDARVAEHLEQVRAAVKDGFVAYEKASRAGTLQAPVEGRKAASPMREEYGADAAEGRREVSTTRPKSKGSDANSYTQNWVLSGEDVRQSQRHLNKIAEAFKSYNVFSREGSTEDVIREAHDVIVENLLWLHDLVPPAIRSRAKLWYDGANVIAKDWSQVFGLSERQTSGILAVLSPQMDWFKNVSLAERVITTLQEQGDTVWSPDMTAWVESWVAASDNQKTRDARTPMIQVAERLAGVPLKDMSDADAAKFVRIFDETYNDRAYRLVTPEGGFGDFVTRADDGDQSVTWGGFETIRKAVSIYRDGSFRNIDEELGSEHKVRNFYNNIISPKSADDHVTIDTHAVAAATVKALSGSAREVEDNFGGAGSNAETGASGSYAIFLDAYRDAAAQRGILGREMQSITWEAVRALFPASTKKIIAPKVEAIWDRFRAGEITREQARAEVFKLADGLAPMAWEGSDTGIYARDGGRSFKKADSPRTLEAVSTKNVVRVSLSAATNGIPGIKHLYELAPRNAKAAALLQDIALDSLRHLVSGTRAKVIADRVTGLYGGAMEPSLGVTVTFGEFEKDAVLAALAKFADNFKQEQIHVRREVNAPIGTDFGDGSVAVPVYRWELNKAMTRSQIEKVIDESGLFGLTAGDGFLEAYFVAEDYHDDQAIADFYERIRRADASLGSRSTGLQERTARLWAYGHGFGATAGYDAIRGGIQTSSAVRSETAKRVAEFLAGQPVKTFEQAKSITGKQQALQSKIAAVFSALPDNDLKRPTVRQAYQALAKEVLRQYRALPIKVEVLAGQGEPYRNSDEMRRDILDNNHLFVFGTTPDTFGPPGVSFKGHPLLKQSGLVDENGYPLLFNDLLRAVHDYYAHAMAPTQFGPKGEEAAWKNHMSMTGDPYARWALTAETRGQNSWVNFRGDLDPAVPVKDRPFARQKAALLPLEFSLTGDEATDAPIRTLMDTLTPEEAQGSFDPKSEQSSQSVVKSSGRLSAKRAAAVIRAVAQETADDFFRLPTTDETDMLRIAEVVGQSVFKVSSTPGIDPRAQQAWTLRTEGQRGDHRYHRDAYIFQNQYGMVWVNVGGLETGDQGGRVYQIAGAYARNNGLRFIGDPDGITEAGKRRRLENMIGLALKYGDTKFLAPHQAMQGWNRLVWDPNSDDNLLPMLQASYNFVSRVYPEIKDVTFSLDTGRFQRAGTDLGGDDFTRMAGELRGRLGADAAGAPGSGTLRLAALYRSLVQEEDPEGRMGVLLADGDGRAELVRSLTEAKYSRQRTISDLSPDQEAAANRVLGAPKTFAERWQAFKQDWAKNLKQGIFDQFAPILELDPNAYMQARLSKGGDSTLEALLLYGKLRLDASGATDVDYTEAGGFQGFASKMAPLGQEQDRFLLWVAAQRADRLKQIGLENLWSDQDIRELSTLDQGVMADGGARPAVYAQALADLNDFNDNVLSIAEASGLITAETRQMFQDQPYVPFYRLQEEGIQGFGMKPGLVNQAAWKRLKGGTDKLNEDLLANVLKNWSHLITASAKNRAAHATLVAAERAGAAHEVPSGTPGKDLVHVRVQGQERTYAVLDPHLLDAVAALEYAGLGPWSKPLTAAKHWLTIGVTANPTFKLRNLMRDSISAIGTAQLSYNPAKNIGQGWGSTSKESETRAHMLASGGMIRFGSMLDGNTSRRAQALIDRGVDPALILDSDSKIQDFWHRRLRPALDAYNELGDRVENINRAALYDQLVGRGMSHMEASYWARDLMDFSMSGKWTAIRGLVQMVPFFNARLQGLYKLGRAGKQDLKRFGTVLGAVSLFSLGLLFAAKADDDDWKDWQARPDEDRNNYWWFKAGGLAYRIPKPFEIGAVGTIAERGFEIMSDDEMTPKRFGKVMSQIVLTQLSMNPTPQLFKPMMDIYANQDGFTGMPIEGPALEGLRKEDRYDSRTSMVARFLGGLGLPNPTQLAMGRWDTLSPKQIDYLARGYFSWLATMTTVALDYGIRPLVSSGERPTRTLRETFFVGNFVEQLPANGSRYVQNLYEQAREVEQAYASYQAQVRVGNAEGARRILVEERDKIARYRQVEQFKRAESLLTLQQRRIEEDARLSGDEKRTRLDLLQQRKNLLAQKFPGV